MGIMGNLFVSDLSLVVTIFDFSGGCFPSNVEANKGGSAKTRVAVRYENSLC
jgi:hypothetical protein